MRKRDWVVLVALSLVVAANGVFGVSYVVGKGWPAIPLWGELSLTVAFSVLTAVLLILIDAGFEKALRKRPVLPAKESLTVEARRVGEEDAAAPDNRLCEDGGTAKGRARTVLERLVPRWALRSILLFTLIMMLFWLPWYVANFPGGAYWDTYYQIYQVYPENHPIAVIPWEEIYKKTLTDAWIVDHHPFLVTMLYGAFGWGSDMLTGSWMAGVALFCALQGVAHCVAFTSAVAYLNRIGCPKVLCLISYLFFAVMPFVPTWAMCMVKDSLFGLFYIPYFMMLAEAVRTRGGLFARRRNRVWFVVLGVILCLTKKQGLFVVVATCIVGWIAFRRRRERASKSSHAGRSASLADGVAPCELQEAHPRAAFAETSKLSCRAFLMQAVVSVVVMLFLIPTFVFPALNIEKGGTQEVLGPLFQQTAHYIVDYEDEVSEEERDAIATVLDYDKLSDSYTFDFQDAVKYRYNLDAAPYDILRYLQVYAEQGLRHPDSYFGAYMALAGFYVAPTCYMNIRMTTVDTKMGDDQRYMLWNPDELDWLREGLRDGYEAIARIPGLDAPLLIVVYTFWLPAALIYVAQRRRLGEIPRKTGLHAAAPSSPHGFPWVVVMVPQLVLLAFCLIAPVYDARYVIPIFDAAPLLLCTIATLMRQPRQERTAPIAPKNRRGALHASLPAEGRS